MLGGEAGQLVTDAWMMGNRAMRIAKRAQNVCTGKSM